jgi:hypothetical protein
VLRAGWSLVWRRQRLLWWIYVVSLGLAFLATLPLMAMIGPVLDNSLASDRLYHAFDLGFLGELFGRPDVSAGSAALAAVLAVSVFLVLMVLFTGGVLKVYNEDRTFTTGEFFGACGQYFWRFVRLIVLLLIVLIPVGLLNAGIKAWSDGLAERIASPFPSLWVNGVGKLIMLLLMMSVRVWFDMAEVQAVAEDEYAMRRTFARSFRLTWRNFRSLFWIYFAPSVVVWVATGVGLWIWAAFVPHQAVSVTLLITQVIVFLWIFTRLWQRASETLWYQHHAPAPVAVPYAEPVTQAESALMDAPLSQAPPPPVPGSHNIDTPEPGSSDELA